MGSVMFLSRYFSIDLGLGFLLFRSSRSFDIYIYMDIPV